MNTMNPISAVRESAGFTRATVSVVLTTFLAMVLVPSVAAARETISDPTKLLGKPAVVQERDVLNDALKQVKGSLQRMDESLRKGVVPTAEVKALPGLRAALVEADKKVMKSFDADLAHIEKHKLPDVIRQRHAEAVAAYKAKHNQMLAHLAGIAAPNAAVSLAPKVKTAKEWLESQQLEPKAAPFDPNKLGFQVETKKARAPKLTSKELKEALSAKPVNTSFLDAENPIQVATVGSMSGLIAMSAITPPGPEYLAATVDVQITPAIQDLATQLHRNPVEIYNWVRNNIEWIPTYGSVQGSAMTLEKKAGNAFDTSSLLIALLRASGIPSRYAYGTIQVPIAQAMNWAGGFKNPDALQTLLATGGIPNNALTSGGVTKYIRMEHSWVEAFVDFYPSRGAKNIAPDTWVPMDASFKQYVHTEGVNLTSAIPFNAETFLAATREGATINEAEGWVQNLNRANIESHLDEYRQQLRDFIEAQGSETTVGELLGTKVVVQATAPLLPASLPYKLVATGNRYSALPSGLRHQFQYKLYSDQYQRSIENPLWSFQESTPYLAGKKITLSFVPATDADRETIESYLPRPHTDGSPIQPGEFPNSLPAYNIRVTAELKVEGQVVARGGTFTLGTELVGEGGFTYLSNLGEWDLTQEEHVAGQASALGLSIQGIARTQLTTLKSRLDLHKVNVTEGDTVYLANADLSGDMLTACVWGYFSSVESYGRIAQKKAGMVDIPTLSYGFFRTDVEPEYRYGLVHRAHLPGVLMDIGHQRRVAFSLDNNLSRWIAYNQLRGQHSSAMEHGVPEHSFDDPGTTGRDVQSVSAVKALGIAALEGQRIYTIDGDNASQAVAALTIDAAAKSEILAAANVGKVITVHQSPIQYAGFTGAGYVIVDPDTGAGSYKISGGSNGSRTLLQEIKTLFFAVTSVFLFFGALFAAVSLITVLALPTVSAAIAGALLALFAFMGALSIMAAAIAFNSSLACQISTALAASTLLSVLVSLLTELFIASATIAAWIGITSDISGNFLDIDVLLEHCEGFGN